MQPHVFMMLLLCYAQALALEPTFVFEKGAKGDLVRLAAVHASKSHADVDSSATADSTGSDDSDADCFRALTPQPVPLSIVQLIQVETLAALLQTTIAVCDYATERWQGVAVVIDKPSGWTSEKLAKQVWVLVLLISLSADMLFCIRHNISSATAATQSTLVITSALSLVSMPPPAAAW
jgi:hypothetical protein